MNTPPSERRVREIMFDALHNNKGKVKKKKERHRVVATSWWPFSHLNI